MMICWPVAQVANVVRLVRRRRPGFGRYQPRAAFNSADHALDAASEGAGVLLAHDLLAHDDLRTGRLIIPVALPSASGRAYHVVCPKHRSGVPQVRAFRDWIKQEVAALDWAPIRGKVLP